jgi:hypothetical protein
MQCKAQRRELFRPDAGQRSRAERRNVGGVIGARAACLEAREIAEIGQVRAGPKRI